MADIYAVFGTLIALGIAYPGMLAAWRLLFPQLVEESRSRWSTTPWRCLGFGTLVGIPTILVAVILLALPLGFIKLIGLLLSLGGLWLSSIGAAGLVSRMAERLGSMDAGDQPDLGSFLKAALALELAAAFPLIGWFLMIPLSLVGSFGAAVFALLGGRSKEEISDKMEAAPSSAKAGASP